MNNEEEKNKENNGEIKPNENRTEELKDNQVLKTNGHHDFLKPNHLSDKSKKGFKNRSIYALILFSSATLAFVLGGWFFFAFQMIFLVGCVWEITKIQFKKFPIVLFLINLTIVFSLVLWPTLKFLVFPTESAKFLNISHLEWFINDGFFNEVWLSPIAIAFSLGVYFTIAIFKKEFTISHVFYFFTMTLLLGIGFQCLLGVRYLPFRAFNLDGNNSDYVQSPFFKYLQSVFFITISVGGIALTDLGAYIFGIFFGKHKLNPRISPNKTVEGFIGGIFTSFLITTTFMLTAAACGCPVLPIYDLNHWYLVIILCFCIPFISTLGDFAFSAIKRLIGVKDYSNALGEMGGFADRVDSIMFGAMFVLIFTTFFSNIVGNIYYYA